MFGLVVQDNDVFLSRDDIPAYNVDVSIDDIVAHYTTHCEANPQTIECMPSTVSLPNSEEIDLFFDVQEQAMNRLTDFGKELVRMFLMAAFNVAIKNADMDGIQADKHSAFLSNIILTYRNQIVAQAVHESEENHIFLIYGALHSKGIIEELKKYDPKWKEKKIEALYPYQ